MDATQMIPPRDRRTRGNNRLQQLLPTYHSRLEFVTDASIIKEFRSTIGCVEPALEPALIHPIHRRLCRAGPGAGTQSPDPECSFKYVYLNCLKFTGCLDFQVFLKN